MDNVTLIEKLFVCLFHYPLRAQCHCPRPVFMNGGGGASAANRSIGSTTGCTIMEKAPTRAFSWLKALLALSHLRHY